MKKFRSRAFRFLVDSISFLSISFIWSLTFYPRIVFREKFLFCVLTQAFPDMEIYNIYGTNYGCDSWLKKKFGWRNS